MTETQSFVLSGVMTATPDRGALLVIAAALHRRGVEVIEAGLRRPSKGVRTFEVTFLANPRQATTALRTVENLVEVLDARLYDFLDARTAC